MFLGLLTDIHEQVDHLSAALARFERLDVDQIIVFRDIFEMGEWIKETCQLLARARAVGVWGNRDFGLACEPSDHTRRKYGPAVLDYMTCLRPRLDLAGWHFTHVEPWLNPECVSDLWYFDGPPDQHGQIQRSFDGVPHRWLFAGHFHKWLAATPYAISNWAGERSIRLAPARHLVVIGALCQGRFATFNTDTCELVPFNGP